MPLNENEQQVFNSIVHESGIENVPIDMQPLRIPLDIAQSNELVVPLDLFNAIRFAQQKRQIDEETASQALEFFDTVLQSGRPAHIVGSLPVGSSEGGAYIELKFPSSDDPYAP